MQPRSLHQSIRLCTKPSHPSACRAIYSVSHGLDRTKTVEIIVSASRKAHELLWLMGQPKQALAKGDRYRGIAVAMHDKQGRADPQNAPIGMKLITHQETDRHDAKHRAGHVR